MEHSSHLPKLANAVQLSLSELKTAELKHGCISFILVLVKSFLRAIKANYQ